jgi:hypothetical protein
MATSCPIRAYTYEMPESIVPYDVLKVLGVPSHVIQARVLVFAATAKLAHGRLIDLGIRPSWDTKLPRRAYGNDVDALTFAEYNKPGAVFVIAEQSRNVAEVDFSSDGFRESRLVGTIGPGSILLRIPDRAVCDACGWEGTEDDIKQHGDAVVGDPCPRCGQDEVNYFSGGPE